MNNALPKAVNAYQKSTTTVRSDRDAEREIIAKVTHQLRVAKERRNDGILLARAVSDNLSLWYVLISDLASEGNQLPLELRGKLISVGMAVVRECEQLDRTRVNVDFLINVNQSIIEGLTDTP